MFTSDYLVLEDEWSKFDLYSGLLLDLSGFAKSYHHSDENFIRDMSSTVSTSSGTVSCLWTPFSLPGHSKDLLFGTAGGSVDNPRGRPTGDKGADNRSSSMKGPRGPTLQ